MPAPLLIRGGLVANPASATATPLDLLIEHGHIARIAAPGSIPCATVFDATDRLILPGLVNAHTHGHANLAKGVADRWTLEASLTNGAWLAGARDPEAIYVSTLLGAIDMLQRGCTACYDLVHEFPLPTTAGFAAVAQAYADAGIRAALAPLVADRSLFHAIPGLLEALPPDLRAELAPLGTAPREATIAALDAIAAAKSSLPPGITLAIAPTIPHHCTERFLLQCLDIADRHALPIHMHIAESRLQAVVARQLWGVSPIGYLDRLGILRPGFTAAHAVWLDAGDLDILAARGCAVAHIPASNLRLGSGIAHIRPMLDRGITVGLATDGANSSDALSMLQAMRLASYGARAFAGPRDAWLTAAETVRLATAGGADLLGLPQGGRIEPGAPADLAFFDLGHIDFIPLTDPFNQLVTCADGASVTDVMVAGRLVVRDRRITTVDTSQLRDRVAAVLARLRPATAAARALAERLEPHVVAFAARAGALPIDRFIQAAS